MYSLMALAGDLGCASGPFIAGMICNFAAANGANESAGMKTGLGFSVLFPVILIVCTLIFTFVIKNVSRFNFSVIFLYKPHKIC